MKAYMITPASENVEVVDISGIDDIINLIGYSTIEADPIDENGTRLYFDEECFIRGDAVSGRFQLDSLIPVAGLAVVAGSDKDAEDIVDVKLDIDELRGRIKFL
jgi:hypothetical protein